MVLAGNLRRATRAGGAVNEDRVGASGSYFWALDGATGLTPGRWLPGPSDAAWFANTWSDALAAFAADASSPFELIVRAHAHVMHAVRRSRLDGGESGEPTWPAMALALAQIGEGKLRLCNIGDCSALLRRAGEHTRRLGSSKVDQFDATALDIFQNAQRAGASYAEAASLSKKQILRNRALANTPGGYWVVDPTDRWLDHVECFEVAFQPDAELLLATDGFMRVLDPYGIASCHCDVLEFCDELGLSAVIDRIRSVEADDPECRVFPRLKPSDDASAIWLRPKNN